MRAVVRGGGSIGRRHTEVLRRLGLDVALWPVRPRPPDAAVIGDLDGPRRYADADLAVIATDTARHVDDAVLALDAGARTVLVEKPVAAASVDVTPLLAHPRAEAVSVAAPLRAHAGLRDAATVLNRLPAPLSVYVYCQSWLPDWRPERDYRTSYSARPDEGGALRDLIHEIDYALALFGPAVLAGAALQAGGPLPIRSEQAASLLWTTKQATVQARLDYVTRPASRGFVARSAAGFVEWDVLSATVTAQVGDGPPDRRSYPEDLDRNLVLATQARALLGWSDIGAPATLREGCAAVQLCDDARRMARQTR